MNRPHTYDPRDGSAPRGASPAIRSGDDFWTEFRTRAQGLPRSGPPSSRAMPAMLLAAALLAAGAGVALLAARPAAGARAAVVESLEVGAEHSGIVVIQGSGDDPTIVWILGMPAEAGDNGA